MYREIFQFLIEICFKCITQIPIQQFYIKAERFFHS